ncbi:MAG: DUF1294 domain-containing protein [bacterium]
MFIIVNFIALIVMGVDKYKSIKNSSRISEKVIITHAFIFGALGIYLGMYIFRHKINKSKFYIIIPILMIFQLFIFYNFIINR